MSPLAAGVLRRVTICCVVVCGVAAFLLVQMEPSPASRQHLSPDGQYAVVLASDTRFGQVEHLRVLEAPGTSAARVIFVAAGDTPLHFLGWRDGVSAELEEPPRNDDGARRLLLRCAAEGCQLHRAPGP